MFEAKSDVSSKRLIQIFVISFIAYSLAVLLVGWLVSVIQPLGVYTLNVKWSVLGISMIFFILTSTLFALAISSIYSHHVRGTRFVQGFVLTIVGALGGLIAGLCPLCIVGLVPLFFNFFGISLQYSSFPLGGVEIQIVSVLLLAAGNYMLGKK